MLHYLSPLGSLYLTASALGVTAVTFKKKDALDFLIQAGSPESPLEKKRAGAHLKKAKKELDQYFKGKRKVFTFDLDFMGTPFQAAVWIELLNIPYGQVLSYGELAKKLKKPKAFRAVGSANGKNPLCIVIPCHRVIASKGKLGGYAGGLKFKKGLLKLEKSLTDITS